ncbi:stalk domain-containing protein [Paenibacillus sp. GCM10023252]|uniref:stalk domain-containing protein n=1 Tax=Paenibacillus sp. GCM10023252 TaxID=3252649 RepID=UPI0036226206
MRINIVLLIIVSMFFTIPGLTSAAAEPVSSTQDSSVIGVIINDVQQKYDQPPINLNGSIMVPLRAIFESLGAVLKVEGKQITATKDKIMIHHTIGTDTATINGKQVKLAQKSLTKNNRTLVPLRFVGEALQAKVSWDGAARNVYILDPVYESGQKKLAGELHEAVLDENDTLVKSLLEKGANPRFNKGATFYTSVLTKNIKIISLFLQHGADINTTGSRGSIIELITHSHLVNRKGYSKSNEETDTNVLSTLLTYKPDLQKIEEKAIEPLVLKPIQQGRLGIVKLLLEAGASADSTGRYDGIPPIIAAITTISSDSLRNSAMVELLLQYGADPNECTCYNGRYVTALELANTMIYGDFNQDGEEDVSVPQVDMIEALLQYGAEVDVDILFTAVSSLSLDITKLLLEAGADMHEVEYVHDRSPYEQALLIGNKPMIDLLESYNEE